MALYVFDKAFKQRRLYIHQYIVRKLRVIGYICISNKEKFDIKVEVTMLKNVTNVVMKCLNENIIFLKGVYT